MSKKPSNTICLLLQNVGGIDIKPEGSAKLAALHAFMEEAQVDLAALTECNVARHLVERDLYPSEQTKCWWENVHWLITHNRCKKYATNHQRGGVCVIVTNQLSYQVQRLGDDMMGLGRWCWACLQGKQDRYLWGALIYQPFPSNRPLLTYQQQVRLWSSKNLDCCPQSKLLEDLKAEMKNGKKQEIK